MEAFEDLLGGTLCTEKEEITETMLRRKRDEVSKQEARKAVGKFKRGKETGRSLKYHKYANLCKLNLKPDTNFEQMWHIS